jgi:CHAD domain-containing protein
MIRSLPLKAAYDRRVGVFREHFMSASAIPSTVAIHEVRVALKRLRSFFDLVGAIDPGFRADRAFAAARKLFRAAGRVRNIQILGAKVYEVSRTGSLELSEYYNWLKEDELREAAKFDRVCGRFRLKPITSGWKSVAVPPEGLADRRIRNRAEARLLALIKEIRRVGIARSDARRLHFLRTRTKEARYTLEILQECGLTGDDGVLFNDRLRDVHQPLGQWHDEEVALVSLREFRKRRDPGPFFSLKSYLEFSRLTKASKADSLACFEAAWAEFSRFLGRGHGQRVFLPSSGRPAADDPPPDIFGPPEQGPDGLG